ncbi:MAG: peptidoglycan DD-metalloendopeptidase family protein [Thiohalomonadaceae bacterium]
MGSRTQKSTAQYHTVRQGETLYSIAWNHGYDYRQVATWNNIGSPYRIYPGQRLAVSPTAQGPIVVDKTINKPAIAAKSINQANTSAASKPPGKTAVKPAPHIQSSINWKWPTSGSVKRRFSDADSKNGITISGRAGQSVNAAAGGDVVYSGSGLVGYGNLLIIKHNDIFLSAYGHNQSLLVKEGATVKSGQQIAVMGETARDGPLLHFEIRQEGRPVDPMRYLPKQR